MNEQPAVLDQATLAELRDSVAGDEAFVKELVGAYLAESPGLIDAMAAAAANGDADGVVRPAHTLKSSSAAIGALRLSAISKQVEHAARDGHVDEAGIKAAMSAWAETVAALTAAGLAP
jgi:HPt (histidine-containing phosphotransfer) domain-containing protein